MIAEFPTGLISGLERRLVTSVSEVTSPFTGTQQIQDWGGEWWAYAIETSLLTPADGRRAAAFFAALGGARGRFVFRDPSIAPRYGLDAGVVDGTVHSDRQLLTRGWQPDQPLFAAGEFISLGAGETTQLYQITADVTSDVAGRAGLAITPRLRGSVVDGMAVEVSAPGVVLRLSAPVPARIGRAGKYQFSFEAREAL